MLKEYLNFAGKEMWGFFLYRTEKMKSTLMLVRQIQGRGISLKTKSRGRTAQLINFSIMTNSSCFFKH